MAIPVIRKLHGSNIESVDPGHEKDRGRQAVRAQYDSDENEDSGANDGTSLVAQQRGRSVTRGTANSGSPDNRNGGHMSHSMPPRVRDVRFDLDTTGAELLSDAGDDGDDETGNEVSKAGWDSTQNLWGARNQLGGSEQASDTDNINDEDVDSDSNSNINSHSNSNDYGDYNSNVEEDGDDSAKANANANAKNKNSSSNGKDTSHWHHGDDSGNGGHSGGSEDEDEDEDEFGIYFRSNATQPRADLIEKRSDTLQPARINSGNVEAIDFNSIALGRQRLATRRRNKLASSEFSASSPNEPLRHTANFKHETRLTPVMNQEYGQALSWQRVQHEDGSENEAGPLRNQGHIGLQISDAMSITPTKSSPVVSSARTDTRSTMDDHSSRPVRSTPTHATEATLKRKKKEVYAPVDSSDEDEDFRTSIGPSKKLKESGNNPDQSMKTFLRIRAMEGGHDFLDQHDRLIKDAIYARARPPAPKPGSEAMSLQFDQQFPNHGIAHKQVIEVFQNFIKNKLASHRRDFKESVSGSSATQNLQTSRRRRRRAHSHSRSAPPPTGSGTTLTPSPAPEANSPLVWIGKAIKLEPAGKVNTYRIWLTRNKELLRDTFEKQKDIAQKEAGDIQLDKQVLSRIWSSNAQRLWSAVTPEERLRLGKEYEADRRMELKQQSSPPKHVRDIPTIMKKMANEFSRMIGLPVALVAGGKDPKTGSWITHCHDDDRFNYFESLPEARQYLEGTFYQFDIEDWRLSNDGLHLLDDESLATRQGPATGSASTGESSLLVPRSAGVPESPIHTVPEQPNQTVGSDTTASPIMAISLLDSSSTRSPPTSCLPVPPPASTEDSSTDLVTTDQVILRASSIPPSAASPSAPSLAGEAQLNATPATIFTAGDSSVVPATVREPVNVPHETSDHPSSMPPTTSPSSSHSQRGTDSASLDTVPDDPGHHRMCKHLSKYVKRSTTANKWLQESVFQLYELSDSPQWRKLLQSFVGYTYVYSKDRKQSQRLPVENAPTAIRHWMKKRAECPDLADFHGEFFEYYRQLQPTSRKAHKYVQNWLPATVAGPEEYQSLHHVGPAGNYLIVVAISWMLDGSFKSQKKHASVTFDWIVNDFLEVVEVLRGSPVAPKTIDEDELLTRTPGKGKRKFAQDSEPAPQRQKRIKATSERSTEAPTAGKAAKRGLNSSGPPRRSGR